MDVAAEILGRAAPGEVLVSRTVVDLVAGAGIGFVDRGSHRLAAVRDSWQLLATSAGQAPLQAAPTAMRFRREGDYWTVDYGASVVRMRDAKGLGYLARLLRHPHREFHVLDLLAGDVRHETTRARTVLSRPRRTPAPCWTSPPSALIASELPT